MLSLLPKKGDLHKLRTWRPISLLSTDYKVIVKAISLRLESVLMDVIHPDQTYMIPDRTIFINLYQVQDLLHLVSWDGQLLTLLSLNQEKVSDHGYLGGTWQAFGFRTSFMGFLQVLYASAECLVKLNWPLTEPITFCQGVHQDSCCPASSILLLLSPFSVSSVKG
ncbi:unnamed protein product [Caretta caretta]